MNPPIETTRLLLRPLSDRDAEGLHAAYGDPEAMRFWNMPASVDVLQTAARIGRSLSAPPAFHACWCLVRKSDDAILGMINYHHRESWNRRLELGWILAPAHHGKGLMSEAARAVLAHCFEAMDCHRVEALIEAENLPSIKLAESLGMRCESGLLRDRLLVEGVFRSAMMFGLLKPEWLAWQGDK
jgi:RimJ/RimL family protein N-acetyltransferase